MNRTLDEVTVRLKLESSYLFYHNSKYYSHISDLIIRDAKSEYCKVSSSAVKWFVTNSARTLNYGGNGFYLSLDRNHYSGNKFGITYRKVVNLLDFLREGGYINLITGGVKSWSLEDGVFTPEATYKSYCTFTDKYQCMWEGVDFNHLDWSDIESKNSVVIKDRATGKPKPLGGHKGVSEIKVFVETLNNHLKGRDITFDGEPIADTRYFRSYLDNLKYGGRIYAEGGGVQLLPKSIRKEYLEIEGEPVIELDYKAMHPSILYQMVLKNTPDLGRLLGDKFNPYEFDTRGLITVNLNKKSFWEDVFGCNDPVRSLIKFSTLIAINCMSFQQARSALVRHFKDDKRLEVKDQKYHCIEYVNFSGLLRAVENHNRLIKDYLFSDQGVILQNIDSSVMTRVLSTLIDKDVVALLYHDSAIVKESERDTLYQAMHKAWLMEFGDDTFCKIE